MSDLRDDLSRRAARFSPGSDAYQRVLNRVARRRTARRFSAGAVACVIAFAALAGLWSATRSVPGPVATPAGSIPPSPGRSPQALPYDGLEVTLSEKVGGWVVLADATGVNVAAGRPPLTLVNPDTGSVTPGGSGPWDYDFTVLTGTGEGTAFVGSGMSLWVLAPDGTGDPPVRPGDWIHRCRPRHLVRWRLRVGGCRRPDRRTRPGAGRHRYRAVIDRYRIGQGLHAIADAGGYVFVASRDAPRTVVRIDPSTGSIRTVPGILPSPSPVAIGGVGDRLWLVEGSVQEGPIVHCVTAADFSPCGEIPITWASGLATDGRLLWVLSGQGLRTPRATVTLIDGMTGRVLGGPVALPAPPSAMTISAYAGRAWVGFHDSGRLVGIQRCRPGSCPSPSG